jgi:tetratricopeptide (TPR) repeat protein
MANRYTYIPAIGIFIAGTWLGADLLARWPLHRPIIIAACVLILSACVIKTSFQLPHWENSETLLKHAVALDPKNYLALEALADEFGQQKKTNDQMDCYERVLKIKPDRPFARANAGLILSLSGHPKQAAVQYQMAMQSILAAKFALTTSERQRASDIANNLAWIRATSLDPNLRNTTDALELAQHSIEWTGGTGDAVQLDTLAAAQAQAGKFDSAVTTARRALDLAKTTRQPQLVSQIERHISLYEMEQPFREFPE